MKKKNSKERVEDVLEQEKKLLSPQERKLLKELTRYDPKERFRKVVY